MAYAAIGWAIVKIVAAVAISYGISRLTQPDGPDIEGARLDEMSMMDSCYGAPIPIVYGTMRVSGNIIWSTGLSEHKKSEDVGGGKGGGSSGSRTTYTYSCSFALGICQGEIIGVNRIWMDGKLFQDRNQNNNFRALVQEVNKADSITIYTGTEDQEPDPVMEAHEAAEIIDYDTDGNPIYDEEGNVPAYRGLAYIVFEGLELGDYGNRIPNIEVEVAVGLTTEDLTFPFPLPAINMDFFNQGESLAIHSFEASPGLSGMGTYHLNDTGDGFVKGVELHSDYPNAGGLKDAGGKPELVMGYSDPVFIMPEGQHYGHVSNKTRVVDALTGEPMPYEPTGMPSGMDFWDAPNIDIFDVHHVLIPQVAWRSELGGYGTKLYVHNITIQAAEGLLWNAGLGDIYPWETEYLADENGDPFVEYIPGPFKYNPGTDEFLVGRGTADGFVLYIYDAWEFDRRWNSEYEVAVTKAKRKIFFDESLFVEWVQAMDILNGNLVLHDADQRGGNGTLRFFEGISNNPLKMYTFGDVAENTQPLDAIVADIFEKAGLSSAEYDVSDLSDYELVGFAVGRPMSAKSALKPLIQAYQFDVIEAEGKIKCVSRGQSLARSFSENELAAREQGTDPKSAITATRAQENELPTKVTVKYKDQNSDYQIAAQYAKRITQDHFKHDIIDLPITTTADHALQIAETLLATAWAEQTSYAIETSIEHIDLLPGASIEAAGYRMHIEQIQTKLPGLLEITGSSEEPSSYVSTSTASAPDVVGQVPAGYSPITHTILMNLPGLTTVYNQPGFFIAPYSLGEISGWKGAVVYKTNDNGDTWIDVGITTSQTLVARIDSAPGEGLTTRWDNSNTIKITPMNRKSDLLVSATKISALAGNNTAAIGTTGGDWEIISYTDVTDNEDGTFTLSGLLRGRRGTEHAVASTKYMFVLLREDSLLYIPVDTAYIGDNRYYKTVTLDRTISGKSPDAHICNGDTIKPWSPAHITGIRDEGGDLTITWLRRSRAEASWHSVDVPVAEASEAYEIDIMDGDTVVRTLSISGEDSDQSGVTYTASQQTTDFGSVQSSVAVKIYQISDVVGRGFPGEVTI